MLNSYIECNLIGLKSLIYSSLHVTSSSLNQAPWLNERWYSSLNNCTISVTTTPPVTNESNSKEGYWDRNQEAEDRRWEIRNKNLNSVYCHSEQKSKNEEEGKNENLSRTRADKVLNKSQRSVHWQQGIVHDVTWGSAAAGFEAWNSSRAS